jgi:hypothetical protein
MSLPEEYVRYVAGGGPREGGLVVEPGWFQLWPADEISKWNREYQVEEFAPGYLGFGSSGGGEMLAFDKSGQVVMLPFVGMSPGEAKPIAESWKEFIEKIEK